MTKPKFKPRGMVRPDTVFHLCSRFDGEWYATITARSDVKDADPIVAIAGPFADLEEAKAHTGQCMELSRPQSTILFGRYGVGPGKGAATVTTHLQQLQSDLALP
jgi:hypothetical protein